MRDLWTVGQHCLFTALQQPSTLKRENFFYPKSRYFFIRICPDFRSQTWHIVYSVGYKVAIVIAKVIPEKPELSTSFSSREPLGGMTEFCIRLYICKTNRFAKPKCLPSTEKNWKHLNGVIVHFPLKWAKINTPFFLKTFDTIFFVIWKKPQTTKRFKKLKHLRVSTSFLDVSCFIDTSTESCSYVFLKLAKAAGQDSTRSNSLKQKSEP